MAAAHAARFLPAWQQADMPEAPALSLRNALHLIGPGAILAATSIGGGEWLVGPATAVKYGAGLMGIATIAIVLQVVLNLESVRYTLCTGEPIYGGFLRLWPGPRLWAPFYSVFVVVQLAWPALALSAAGSLFSLWTGELPGQASDGSSLQWIGSGLVVLTAAILLFGGTIERTLEIVSWAMLAYIFVFLLVVNIVFVPLETWGQTLRGFFTISAGTGQALDWTLLGALAVGAGAGGVGNMTISNYFRDKGFGMGKIVGAISGAVGGRHTTLSATGTVFAPGPQNVARFRRWWAYAHFDQIFVWGMFCFVGLFLTTNLATGLIPRGSDMEGMGAGAYQALHLGGLWRPLWHLTLLNGFWILFSTQLGNTDLLVRTITDVLWMGSPRVRRWSRDQVGRVYYAGLALLSLWAFVAIRMGGAFALFKLLANIGSLLIVVAAFQIIRVNRRLLPAPVRTPGWRVVVLLAVAAFYGTFLCLSARDWLGGA